MVGRLLQVSCARLSARKGRACRRVSDCCRVSVDKTGEGKLTLSLLADEPDETEKPSERVRYKLPMKVRLQSKSRKHVVDVCPLLNASAEAEIPLGVTRMLPTDRRASTGLHRVLRLSAPFPSLP